MLDEILSQDTSPIIGREDQTETKISEIKYESLDDTMSFSNILGTTDPTEDSHEILQRTPSLNPKKKIMTIMMIFSILKKNWRG